MQKNIIGPKISFWGQVQTTWTNEGGGGVAQMTTTLNNSYLVKVSTKGGGGQNCPKFCPRGLYTAPYIKR